MKKGGDNMRKEDVIRGLRQAAIFSLGCNEISLFPERDKIIRSFLRDEKQSDADKVKEVLMQLKILFPYLSLIAQANQKDPFSSEVVEAYFIGNELLSKVPIEKTRARVENISRGISLPKGFVPHHNYHLFAVTLQSEGRAVPAPLLNLCMIRLGKVKEVSEKEVKIRIWFVEFANGSPTLSLREEIIERSSVFTNKIENGDMVAVHWQNICQRLTLKQTQWLEYYTNEAIRCVKIKGE